jgi:hypothetical protein
MLRCLFETGCIFTLLGESFSVPEGVLAIGELAFQKRQYLFIHENLCSLSKVLRRYMVIGNMANQINILLVSLCKCNNSGEKTIQQESRPNIPIRAAF